MREKLPEYALIAEIFGGIAIVASLIFVGVQVQQNSAIAKVNAYKDISRDFIGITTLIASDEALAEVFNKSITRQELSQVETLRLDTMFLSMFRIGEIAFVQFKNDFITESELKTLLNGLSRNWDNPMMKQSWENSPVSEEFRLFVDSWLSSEF